MFFVVFFCVCLHLIHANSFSSRLRAVNLVWRDATRCNVFTRFGRVLCCSADKFSFGIHCTAAKQTYYEYLKQKKTIKQQKNKKTETALTEMYVWVKAKSNWEQERVKVNRANTHFCSASRYTYEYYVRGVARRGGRVHCLFNPRQGNRRRGAARRAWTPFHIKKLCS